MTDGVAYEMQDRIHHALDEILVDLRLLPGQGHVNPPIQLACEIADDERHAPENLTNGNETHADDALTQIAQLAFERDGVFVDRSPFVHRDACLDTTERIGQSGPEDDHIAK